MPRPSDPSWAGVRTIAGRVEDVIVSSTRGVLTVNGMTRIARTCSLALFDVSSTNVVTTSQS